MNQESSILLSSTGGALSTMSIFGTSKGITDCNEPPKSFLRTIKNDKIVHSEACCFILYSMTHAHLSLRGADEKFRPFELFKDCYNRGKRRQKKNCQLAKYFSLTKLQDTASEDNEDSMEGATVILDKCDVTYSEVCILPQVVMFDKTTSPFKTLKQIEEYHARFEIVLEKFNKKSLSHLYINWLRLIESYVELIFRDLAIKWCQWLHSVRAARHRRSMQMVLKTLLPKICKIFWQKYFIFQNATTQPISEFSSDLLGNLLVKEFGNSRRLRSKVTFGAWLDCNNGIMIMGNGVNFTQEPPLKSGHVIPTTSILLDQMLPKIVIQKLLLFINIAITECFLNEAD